MVGRLDEWLREHLGAMLIGIIRRDVNSVLHILHELGNKTNKSEEQKLKRDLYYFSINIIIDHSRKLKLARPFGIY